MIVDSSAVVAVLLNEAERASFVEAILAADRPLMSAANFVEVAIVVDRRGSAVLSRQLDQLIDALGITVVDLTVHQAHLAREAHRDYGRGSGHPAALNFGDCFSYALATDLQQPLLFKGDDFGHTDLRPAL